MYKGAQEVMPPLPVSNRWVRILRGLEVVKVARLKAL
jgi:hypothetical protein